MRPRPADAPIIADVSVTEAGECQPISRRASLAWRALHAASPACDCGAPRGRTRRLDELVHRFRQRVDALASAARRRFACARRASTARARRAPRIPARACPTFRRRRRFTSFTFALAAPRRGRRGVRLPPARSSTRAPRPASPASRTCACPRPARARRRRARRARCCATNRAPPATCPCCRAASRVVVGRSGPGFLEHRFSPRSFVVGLDSRRPR